MMTYKLYKFIKLQHLLVKTANVSVIVPSCLALVWKIYYM